MDELIKDLKQALIDVMEVVGEVHDNGENCPYCGSEWVIVWTRRFECPNVEDCAGNKAEAVMHRVNEHLNGSA